jgi:hypothetical protein
MRELLNPSPLNSTDSPICEWGQQELLGTVSYPVARFTTSGVARRHAQPRPSKTSFLVGQHRSLAPQSHEQTTSTNSLPAFHCSSHRFPSLPTLYLPRRSHLFHLALCLTHAPLQKERHGHSSSATPPTPPRHQRSQGPHKSARGRLGRETKQRRGGSSTVACLQPSQSPAGSSQSAGAAPLPLSLSLRTSTRSSASTSRRLRRSRGGQSRRGYVRTDLKQTVGPRAG